MRTETTTRTLYKFEELPEETREKVIENLYDINVNYGWWTPVYEDAEQIGLKITGFDIDRGAHCDGEALISLPEIAEEIIKIHGNKTETYKTAKSFLNDLEALTGKYEDIEDCPEDEIDELEQEFLKSLLDDYRIILQKEYEYLTSEAAIIETIKANDYEFDGNGNLA